MTKLNCDVGSSFVIALGSAKEIKTIMLVHIAKKEKQIWKVVLGMRLDILQWAAGC
jgi:hypothetical protein